MFGFMPVPCCSCTSSTDRRDYRALSCGLCNTLARTYGLPTRFLVNRDGTFLHMLIAGLMPEAPTATTTTCCNPFGAKHPLFQTGPAVDFAAAVTMCGVQLKLQDEAADRNGPSAWGAKAFLAANRQRFAKAHRTLAGLQFPTKDIFQSFASQSCTEAGVLRGQLLPSAAAEPTANAFGTIVGHGSTFTGRAAAEPLYAIGHALGNLIYWLDAVTDYAVDLQRQHFNPIWAAIRQPALTEAAISDVVMPVVNESLQTIRESSTALTFHRFGPLLTTLLSSGLESKVNSTIVQSLGNPPELETLQDTRSADEEKRKKNEPIQSNDGWYCDGLCCCDCCTCCGGGSGDCNCCDCDGGNDCNCCSCGGGDGCNCGGSCCCCCE